MNIFTIEPDLQKNSATKWRIDIWWVLLLTMVALALRFWGLGWGLPFAESRPDELQIISKALGYGSGDLNPHFFNYPSLFSYLLFFLYIIYAIILWVIGSISGPQELLLRFAENPTPFFLIARGLSAVLGSLTVPALYLIARRYYGRIAAVCAALFLCVAYLHVRDSHFGVTDVPMTAMVVAAYLPILRILERGRRWDYVWAGLLAGLATSMKYNAALLAVSIFLAHWQTTALTSASIRRRLTAGSLWLAAAAMLGGFFLTSPFVLLDWSSFIRDFMFEVRHLGGAGETVIGRGWLVHLQLSLWHGIGPAILAMAVIGGLCGLLLHRKPTIVLLSFSILYYCLIGKGYTVLVRYAMLLIPFLCLFAGVATGNCIRPLLMRWCGRKCAGFVLGGIVLLLAWTPLCNSLKFVHVISQPDTRRQALEYVCSTLPSGSALGWIGTRYGMPLFPETPECLEKRFNETRTQGHSGRLIQARMKIARRASYGLQIVQILPEKISLEEELPPYIMVEYYPLPYTLKSTLGAGQLLDKRKYRRVIEFSGASMVTLNSRGMQYDIQDSLYVPYCGIERVAFPGPVLTLWKLTASSP